MFTRLVPLSGVNEYTRGNDHFLILIICAYASVVFIAGILYIIYVQTYSEREKEKEQKQPNNRTTEKTQSEKRNNSRECVT